MMAKVKRSDFTWGALLHLGSNMWDDYIVGPSDWAKSPEEEKLRPNPYGPSGRRRSSYHSYLRCHDDLWRQAVDHAAEEGLTTVFVDLGEGMAYPSHPRARRTRHLERREDAQGAGPDARVGPGASAQAQLLHMSRRLAQGLPPHDFHAAVLTGCRRCHSRHLRDIRP